MIYDLLTVSVPIEVQLRSLPENRRTFHTFSKMLIENIVLQAAEENAYKYLDIHAQSKEPDNILILG